MKQIPTPIDQVVRRAIDFETFVSELAPLGDGLSHHTWVRLFDATSGWLSAGTAVIEGASTLALNLDSLPTEEYPRIVSINVLAQLRREVVDSPDLRLAHLLSFIELINQETIALCAEAVPQLGSPTTRLEVDAQRATTVLREHGILVTVTDQDGSAPAASEFTIPPVIQGILRRVFDQKSSHSEAKSRRAIGNVFSRALRSPAAIYSPSFPEMLIQTAENGHWDVLAQLWAERAHGLLIIDLEATCRAYRLVPARDQRESAILTEAYDVVQHVDTVARRLETNDPQTILAHTDFELTSTSSLEANLGRLEQGAADADSIVAMSVAAMQSLRRLGAASEALAVTERAWAHIREKERHSRPPSRLSDARFHLDRGITALIAGDNKTASHLLRRATLIGEATQKSPFLLSSAYAYGALANISNGSGAITIDLLRKFEDLTREFPFLAEAPCPPYSIAKMIVAMDALDLEAATRIDADIPDPSLGFVSWVPAMLFKSILGILKGEANLAEKRLEQTLEANAAHLGEPIVDATAHMARVYLHLASGHTHVAQTEILSAETGRAEDSLALARFKLSVGEYEAAESVASRVQFLPDAQIRAKASARALQAACRFRMDRNDEARPLFLDALEYCRIIGTVQAVAFLPKEIRDGLVELTADSEHWDLLGASFTEPRLDGETVRSRLLSLGETFRENRSQTHLTPSEIRLITLLDRAPTVAALARELALAEGTVKNKLSKLYKRLGVRNRKGAIAYGYENGYLTAGD